MIRRVLRQKLNTVLEARKGWPRFATLGEDVILMSSWWLNKQGAKKVILWDDTTHISISAARDAHLNRHTNSAYYAYAGNVAKGAVFLQLCSWMGTWELNYGLERFPRRNIKLEAASLSTCIGLLIISTKEFHSPSLLTRGIAVSWQLGMASGKPVVSPTCVCNERSKVQKL